MFCDLLFYNIKIKSYVVVKIKTSEFKLEHLGQLSGYVSAINHDLKQDDDNQTIGLLICKSKNDLLVRYIIENFKIPLGISEYELNNTIIKNMDFYHLLKNLKMN